MNSEQLISARLARWSQNGEARLTQAAAADWLDAVGFCCYLPIRTIPAPSFVEAVVGRPAPVPSAGERSRSNELLSRLVKNALAVPLKLNTSAVSEEPDFIASAGTLRYIYALRGDRNFKGAPSIVGAHKVTSLALHCWQKISEGDPLDADELQSLLGGDVTAAAIRRALQELWTALYIFPTPEANDGPPKWDLIYRRFPQQAAAGSSTGHAEAMSAMVSLYLQAAVAVPEEDVLSILSPLASQSKLREVVRALGAMRQLDILDIGGRAHVSLQGSLLPEMVAQLPNYIQTESISSEDNILETAPRDEVAKRSPNTLDRVKKFAPRTFGPKKFPARNAERRQFSSAPRQGPRKGAEFSRPPQFGPRDSGRPQRDGRFRPDDKNERRFGTRLSGSPGKNKRAGSWDESEKRTEGKSYGNRNFSKRPPKPSGFPQRDSKPWVRKGDSRKRFDAAKRPRDFEANPSVTGKTQETQKRWKKPTFGPRSDENSRSQKPWKKNNSFRSDDAKRSGRPGDRKSYASSGPGKKFGGKPFRKKGSGGGKDGAAVSRTNRPRRDNGGKNR